ncbi:MAG: metallophosphoesterase family protein [Bacteroidales bacterium]|nr:metallophosphoesterase family protein [Bacteroidales bacterium]
MIRIALLSDTHGYLDERFIRHINECDEIWHAGDIGTEEVAFQLLALKPMRAVHGNVDGRILRAQYPLDQRFVMENVDVWIRHIGGYPGHYEKNVHDILLKNSPKLFICGHSHILKVQFDKRFKLLYVNPGAAGKYGFQKVQTLIKFALDDGQIRDMEVVELSLK